MHRGYVVDHYRQLIAKLRQRMPDIGLSTDVIVGFPGETEAQFENTLDDARRVPLRRRARGDVLAAAGHRGSDSRCTTTFRARKSGADCTRSKRSRSASPRRSTRAISARTVDVLVEGTAKGRWYGRTRTNKLVHFSDQNVLAGEVVDVEVTATEPWFLEGRVTRTADRAALRVVA